MSALLETNNIKLNNGSFAKYSYTDDWSRKIYKFENGREYCLLDDEVFYTITPNYGEPDCPLKEEYQPKDINIYRFEDQQISLDDWEDYFEPIENKDDGGYLLFDSYRDAYIYAKDKFSNEPYQHVWCIVDGDGGLAVLLNGNHLVNIIAFVVCKTPWGTGKSSDGFITLEAQYEVKESE
jgi:hypothetical protein